MDDSSSEPKLKTALLAVVVLTLLAAVLRFYRATDGSIWLDEGYTILLSRLSNDALFSSWPCDDNPFLASRLYRWWSMLFGGSELAFESLAIVFAVLSVPAAAYLAWQLFGTRAAVWTAFLLSASAIHVRYAQFIRVYSAALFFLILAAVFLLKFVREGRGRDGAAWVIAASLTVYLHYLGALLIGCLVLGALLIALRRGRFKQLVLSCAAIGVLVSPALYMMFSHYLHKLTMGWMRSPAFQTFVSIWYHLSSESALLLFLLLSGVVFAGYAALRSRQRTAETLMLFCWMLLPVAVIWALSQLGSSMFHVRYFIFVLPAFVILAAAGFSRLAPMVDVVWILPLVIVLSGNALGDYYFERKESAAERSAYQFLNDHFQGGDVVLHMTKCSYVPSRFYAEGRRKEYLIDSAPTSRTLRCAGINDDRITIADVAKYNRLWLFNRDCFPRRASQEVFQRKEFKDLYPRLLYESPDGSLSLFDLTYREIFAGYESDNLIGDSQ